VDSTRHVASGRLYREDCCRAARYWLANASARSGYGDCADCVVVVGGGFDVAVSLEMDGMRCGD
jgi:hypothetical protein